ncbi:MAG TPA: Ppx/GppA phosphatase family protein [Alphaproteobacteria bacterium]|nr:Ppx/GppA phosphatase family protein [Alphaproteobacteria bacterium]
MADVEFGTQGTGLGRRAVIPDTAPIFAALDLGTNNCRLLVARALDDSFQVIDAFSRIVRLGERLAVTGTLGAEAMARSLEALHICAAKLRRRAIAGFRGVATEACRRAANGGAFLARVARETGLRLEIIAPQEEAGLALAGCAPLLDPTIPRAILFDIGGGSTEVIWAAREGGAWRLLDSISLGCGVVSFAEHFGGDRIAAEDYEEMVRRIAILLAPFEARNAIAAQVAAKGVQMLGTSGTVTTIAGVRMDLPRYQRSLVDGSWLQLDEVITASRQLAALDWAGRAAHPCIGPSRADLVVAGCAILEAICRAWPIARLRVADRGLREGIILGLMRAGHGAAL